MTAEKNCGCVIFAVCEYGYEIQVWKKRDEGETPLMVHAYRAGNHRKDSVFCVPLYSLYCVPLDELMKMARATAAELAGEYDVHEDKMEYDFDLESELKESVGVQQSEGDD